MFRPEVACDLDTLNRQRSETATHLQEMERKRSEIMDEIVMMKADLAAAAAARGDVKAPGGRKIPRPGVASRKRNKLQNA